ncbi:MAG TPA: leucine-rich repeat domain-containing protein [Candidatus Blautia faecavium]|uniref:Leucine-rich repeat domain-containing protein n=1 Tax=Candidatus Blautia faecavium TaxID=2838487 RepID=A0A9D2RVJ9_9FIRM|nr:leucine-rich repeat domain-containing protein [Candidatus Blautia faecavium]
MDRKKILYLVIAGILVVLLGKTYLQEQQQKKLMDLPLQTIQVSFNGEIAPNEKLTRRMVKVEALTTSGVTYEVDAYTVDNDQAPEHGASFRVTVAYLGAEQTIDVPITRTKVVDYSIGYPEQDSVLATVYSNGDLEFSGEGDVLTFDGDQVPWRDDEYTHVFFGSAVNVENMDYWFANNEELLECQSIPKNVVSMAGTFSGCTSMQATPELFRCKELRILDNAFQDCTALTKADTLPINVTSAKETFSGCVSMADAPDLSKAANLQSIDGICEGCTSMVSAPMLPTSVISMPNAFSGCINIHETAPYPAHVEDIREAYKGCIALMTSHPIPETVTRYERCYEGCKSLNGTLEINTDSEAYNNLLDNAATSGKELKLSGNSGHLIDIQLSTAGNNNIILADPDQAALQEQRLATELEAAGRTLLG